MDGLVEALATQKPVRDRCHVEHMVDRRVPDARLKVSRLPRPVQVCVHRPMSCPVLRTEPRIRLASSLRRPSTQYVNAAAPMFICTHQWQSVAPLPCRTCPIVLPSAFRRRLHHQNLDQTPRFRVAII